MIDLRRRKPRRRGVSLLELEVAFVVFGVALAGLAPLVIMHLKQLNKLEARLSDTTTYYLAPASSPWVRKLGASATVTDTVPGAAPPAASPSTLEILSIDQSMTADEVTVHVSLQGASP